MAFDDESGRKPDFYVVNTCTNYNREPGTYSWKEDNEPEDGNDHMINSVQYAWIPHRGTLGAKQKLDALIRATKNDLQKAEYAQRVEKLSRLAMYSLDSINRAQYRKREE